MGTTPEQEQKIDALAADKSFVKDATEGGLAEIELGKLAQEKGSTDGVKEFGKRMVSDHTKANAELREAAARARIEAPTQTPRKAKKAADKLSKMSGAEFDRAYLQMALKDHKDAVKAFDREARAGKLPEVRAFAAKTLPTVQEHLKIAEQLEAKSKSGPEVSSR